MIISSSQNSIYKKILSLTTRKGIKEHQLCILSGNKITKEWQTTDQAFWVTQESLALPPGDWKQTITLSEDLFRNIDTQGTNSPLLCTPISKYEDIENLKLNESAIYCACGDPTNLGAIIRSAIAFDVKQLVLLAEAAHPYLPKTLRASSGLTLKMKIFRGPSIKDVCVNNKNLIALDMDGDDITAATLPKSPHILVGEEGQGVPSSFSGQKLSIPTSGQVESLNAAIATSILFYECSKKK